MVKTKIRLIKDVPIIGYRTFKAGEEYEVSNINARYAYVQIGGLQVRLLRNSFEEIKKGSKK